MADLEVKQVNTLPKNSVALTDYLLAIGSTEEYQAKVQDVVSAGLENYKKKYITGYNTNLSIVEAINLIYNLKNDTDTRDGLAAVRALLGEASPDASLGIQSNVCPVLQRTEEQHVFHKREEISEREIIVIIGQR